MPETARLVIAALLLLRAAAVSAECSCIWGGPFSRVQAHTDLVVAGTVVRQRGNSIDLRIERLMRGTTPLDEIRVWLDTGARCRAAVGSFPVDTQWVMALDEIREVIAGGFNPHTPDISYGRRGDYSLSRCGGYWLSQSENLVSGNLSGGARWDMAPPGPPVLLELVAGFVAGELDETILIEAGRADPALQQLLLDTRLFLRRQGATGAGAMP